MDTHPEKCIQMLKDKNSTKKSRIQNTSTFSLEYKTLINTHTQHASGRWGA